MKQSDTNAFVNLQHIVNDVKVDIDDFSERSHKKLIRWATRGMEEFGLHGLNIVKTRKLFVDYDSNCVSLPEDMLAFLAVGTVQDGKFYRFGYNPAITTSLEDITDDYRPADSKMMDYRINDTYYKLDLNNNRIVLSGERYEYVFLKYKSSGVDNESNTYIPVLAQEALIAFVKWCIVRDNPKVPEYIINRKYKDYSRKYDLMMARQLGTIEEIYDVFAESRFQYPQ